MILWPLFCLLCANIVPGALSDDNVAQHPKMRIALADAVFPDEYIVTLKQAPLTEKALRSSNSAVARVRRKRKTQVQRVPSNWFFGGAVRGRAGGCSGGRRSGLRRTEYTTAFFKEQYVPPWGLDRVDQDELPLSNTYTYEYTGRGVSAYVLDSGILRGHEEFTGRVECLQNFFDASQSACDDDTGHGTHVAGTIGGKTYGVAKNIRLKALKVCRNGSCPKSAIIAALDYVASETGKRVVNMSFQGDFSQAIEDAQQRVVDSGAVIVVAAGNGFNNACSTYAASPLSISVGATTKSDARASFSNFGPCVDLWAPGDGITSASLGGNGISATATLKGTSFAAPHVSGIVALHLERGVHPSDVKDVLLSHAKVDLITGMDIDDNNRLAHIPQALEALEPVCLDDKWGRSCKNDSDCCKGHICKRTSKFSRDRACSFGNSRNTCALKRDTGQRCLLDFQCCSMQCNSRQCM